MCYFRFLLFTILMYAQKLNAQNSEPIQLDRPDQTECPFITPKKFIQVECGINAEKVNSTEQSYSMPTILWKYGINEKIELRLITELNSIHSKTVQQTGLNPVTIGFKTSLWEESDWIPKASFIGHITSADLGSESFHTNYIAPSFRFTFQHTLTDKLIVAYNLGAEWNGENADQSYIYTLTTGYSINQHLGCYAELYGFLPKNSRADHRVDGGFTYLLSHHIITDLSGGVGITSNAPLAYVSLGFSFRFKAIK